ncbi:hypothetical protein T484DRAFT_1757594 [Baffinella frigidus]|nr:hypothetical protein T484DRAFT_1757594 [Cryptophyta sp. CCMP2293]
MEAIEAVEAIPIETPIKIKKARSEKQIEAFQKAIAKKAELTLINKEFNESKKQQKEAEVEIKKRFIKSVKEPKEEKIKKPKKKKLIPPPPVESSSEEESEEEEVIVKRKAKPKKKKPVKKIVYEDTSSEDSEEKKEQIVNYAKLIKKSVREKLKDELQEQKLRNAMSSLCYI